MSNLSNAIAQQGVYDAPGVQQQRPATLADMIKSRVSDFDKVMPSQVDRVVWIRMAEAAVKADDKVFSAATRDPAAFMRALLDCARLGHTPGTEDYYLTIRSGKIQGAESWKGMVQRILRSGQFVKVVAEVVFDTEMASFEFNQNTHDRPVHRIDYAARAEGKPVMSYAYAVRADGSASHVSVADPRYIAKVRKLSKGNVWQSWDETMILKTSLRMLIDFVDTSSEDRRQVGASAVTEMVTSTVSPPNDPSFVIDVDPNDYLQEIEP